MGYDLHITRRAFWADDGPDIPLETWLDLVRSDSAIHFPPVHGADGSVVFDSTTPGDVLVRLPDGSDGMLGWFEGNVLSTNPHPPLIARMHALALLLGGTLQGDDGELYGADGQEAQAPPKPAPQRNWLDRMLGRG